MRIIGGHDYYDGAVSFDTDLTRVFVRDGREVKLPSPKKFRFEVSGFVGAKVWRHELRTTEVVFAGKRYRGLMLTRERRASTVYERQPPVYIWSPAKLTDFMSMQDRPRARWNWGNDQADRIYSEDVERYFAPEAVTGEFFDRLVRERILIAVAPTLERWEQRAEGPWTVNGDGLKDIGFGSVLPPWEAYQELDMFLGTILVGDEDRMIKVSDETKLAKYGFDSWSFKNQLHPAKPRGHRA